MERVNHQRVFPAARPAPAPASLAQSAYEALKASILEGHLPPGHEAVEQAIADQLGMSRTPVHEAVLRLQHEGFVEILSRRGIRVLPIAPEDLRETYEILIALEGAAAALLTRRGADAAEILAAMQAATEEMHRSLMQGDRRRWADADDRFHRLLLSGCGNAKLARLAQTAADQAQRARSATAMLRPDPAASTAEHRAILHAIGGADPNAASEAVAAHRSRASQEILTALQAMRGGFRQGGKALSTGD
jgi:DNA-binding GntR family transcriptional regulator